MIVRLYASVEATFKKVFGVGVKPTAQQQILHDRAVEEGHRHYVDPETGYWVFTAIQLREKGSCCGQGCRHCPWPPEEQRRAGRRM